MKKIYLDYAATTPTDEAVLQAMLSYFSENYGNPSSVHTVGQEAMRAVDKARGQVASFLNCQDSEIIFTSGATESNNLAVKGVVESYYSRLGKNADKPHIITTTIEHHCVLETCENLEKSGRAEITYIPVGKDGVVRTEDIEKEIRKNTILISVMYVNNEIGTVQPIAGIGKTVKNKNENRQIKIIFHTDAVQGVNYFDCDVEKLGVDMLSFSGHKIYGPKGVGVLYVKTKTALKRIQDGGAQEFGLRAGTHNVPGVVGVGVAVSAIDSQKSNNDKIEKLRNYLIEKVLKEIPSSYLNGSRENRSPNNVNFRFDNVEGEGLLLLLDMAGVFASTGSACSTGSLEPSHVLLALGLKHEEAHGSLRLTLGKNTTKKEIDYTVEKIKEAVERLRKISGNVLRDFGK